VCGRPLARRRALRDEDTDQPVERDDRCGDDGADAELEERLPPAERDVFELGRGRRVAHGDRPPLARSEVRGRQPADGTGRERVEAVCEPLAAQRHRLADVAEPDEASLYAERATDLGRRDAYDRIDVARRANALRDLRDDAFALEDLVDRGSGAQALDRRGRFRGEGLQRDELLVRERAQRLDRRHEEDRGHPPFGEERDVGDALHAGALGEPLADALRCGGVVDRERRGLVVRARDAGGLTHEVQANARHPLDVTPAGAAYDALRRARVLVDDEERAEVRADERDALVDENARRLLERRRFADPPYRRVLLLLDAAAPLCLFCTRPGRQQERTLAEAREERERWCESEHDGREPCPRVAAYRLALVEDEEAEDQRRRTAAREDERRREVQLANAAALPQEARDERRRRDEVDRPEREQGDRVQVSGLLLGCHWDGQMIGRGPEAARRARPRTALAILKDRPFGPLCGFVALASLERTGRCEPRPTWP
jgi:hypothetical protein